MITPRSALKFDLFAEASRQHKRDEVGDPLQVIARHIDFGALAGLVDALIERGDGRKGGRPAYPTEVMVRILVLKRLYNLSDEQMEYQLLDRMSYKRFCGLANATNIPDRTTVWTFENRIGEAGAKALFDGVSAQLLKKGFIARGGQIIDATLVPAPKQHTSRGEKDLIEEVYMIQELNKLIVKEIGNIAKLDAIRFVPGLPKTRSGKIMRRILRSIAKKEPITQDISTLEDPSIVEKIQNLFEF